MNLSQLKREAEKRGLKYTASEKASAYALACGGYEYAQAQRYGEEPLIIRLYKEHTVYHVRTHNHETGERVQWLSFPTYSEARAAFNKGKKAIINLKLWELERRT